MNLYDTVLTWLVTSLRTDVTLVSNRVAVQGGYQNPTLPRISIGNPVGLGEEMGFIGNLLVSEGDIINLTVPVEIIASSNKLRDQVAEQVLTSLLITQRGGIPNSNGIIDINIAGENNIDEGSDAEKPNVFRKILDFKIMVEKT